MKREEQFQEKYKLILENIKSQKQKQQHSPIYKYVNEQLKQHSVSNEPLIIDYNKSYISK